MESQDDRHVGSEARRGLRERNEWKEENKATSDQWEKSCLVENKKVGMRTGNISPDHGLSYKEEGKEKIIFHFFFSGNCLIDQKPTHHVVI